MLPPPPVHLNSHEARKLSPNAGGLILGGPSNMLHKRPDDPSSFGGNSKIEMTPPFGAMIALSPSLNQVGSHDVNLEMILTLLRAIFKPEFLLPQDFVGELPPPFTLDAEARVSTPVEGFFLTFDFRKSFECSICVHVYFLHPSNRASVTSRYRT
jgi:hypothetical protein